MGKTMMLALAGVVGLGAGLGSAQADHHGDKDRKEGKMEVSGPVANLSGTCPTLEFTVAQQRVATKEKTEFDGLECTEITNGTAVQVEGKVKDGVLMAREVGANGD